MHVAITGASSGIGEATARAFARAGAKLTLVARRRELLDKLALELVPLGGGAHVVTADLAVLERATDWIAAAEAAHGPIDVLINNAGIQVVAPIEHTTLERAEATLRLNLLTPLRLMHAVLPAMLARRSGTIVNVSSLAAITTLRGMLHYNASKAGLASASETLRAELRATGVHVVTVYPGPVKTPLADASLAAYDSPVANLLPVGRAEVLAARIVRAVEKRHARIIFPRFYYAVWWFPGITRFITDRVAPAARAPLAPTGVDRVGS